MSALSVEYLDSLTKDILAAVFEVSNTLGSGFLERVYQRALLRELRMRGRAVRTEVSYPVLYKGECVGEYFADLVVEQAVVVELKCAEKLSGEHMAQCMNYLHASGLTVCLLVNFRHPKVEWKRVVQGFANAH